ncbi:phage portal protein [Bacillus sp. FJAT-45037]|uniref:phage portal protein n=1 Tax=Bacillus sp. FJAT-45037 TaxID=2011007 RepID=UPI000C23AED1|nr:phage portal protein [Bacillus sp. FJAT-45037]
MPIEKGGEILNFLPQVFKRNSELSWMFDAELFEEISEKAYFKRLAVLTCINMIARTISQSEFRVKEDDKTIRDEMYYKLNVRPNKNTSAASFWYTVVYKLIYENQCLIVQNDSDDLLIADSFSRIETANYEDRFKDVTVKGYTFQRTFSGGNVLYIEYANDNLTKLIDSIYTDYGQLLGRMFEVQMLKGGIRTTVDVDQISGKDEEKQEKLQNFINRVYKSIKNKAFSIVPQQKGFTYHEHAKGEGSPSATEINTLTNGFLDQVARALGIPPSFARGEVAENEHQTKNYLSMCIDPLLKRINDETNAKMFTQDEYLEGKHLEIKRVSYQNIFDLASSVDKLRSSGVMNGHEIRDELGLKHSNEPSLDKFLITKNYDDGSDSSKGGETNDKDD